MYGSPPSSKDLNLPPFNQQKQESDIRRHNHNNSSSQQMSSGLLRYRSAPSSLFGEVCEDFLPVRPSSPETETLFARFMTDDIRSEKQPSSRSPHFPPPAHPSSVPPPPQSELVYQHQIPNQGDNSYRVVTSLAMEGDQIKSSSNLIRQNSSPAGFFSQLNVENGYGVMRGMGGYRNGNGSIGDGGMGTGGSTRLKSQLSFSSRQSSGMMSQISEMESEGLDGDESPEESGLGNGGSNNGNSGGGGRCYIPGYPIASWEDSHLLSENNFTGGLKRSRDDKILAGLGQSEAQNGDSRNGLTHQFSLPKTASEMAAIEKFLQFQDSVPCKIRAKRGCATHPRSIAERVRRTRISERMRKLQELVPNMDKQTNTADMLDLAVDYIKDLQKHVKALSDSRASCTCSGSKQKS